jgi:hypothetical protein
MSIIRFVPKMAATKNSIVIVPIPLEIQNTTTLWSLCVLVLGETGIGFDCYDLGFGCFSKMESK